MGIVGSVIGGWLVFVLTVNNPPPPPESDTASPDKVVDLPHFVNLPPGAVPYSQLLPGDLGSKITIAGEGGTRAWYRATTLSRALTTGAGTHLRTLTTKDGRQGVYLCYHKDRVPREFGLGVGSGDGYQDGLSFNGIPKQGHWDSPVEGKLLVTRISAVKS